jgi:hypothetical protein
MEPQTSEGPALYSVEDAARVLGKISSWTLRAHLRRGTVSAVRIGRRLFLNAAEIRRIQSDGLPSLAAPNGLRNEVAKVQR